MLRGSEKDTDGGDKKGGGNGRGDRFANSPMPVSKRKGGFPYCDGDCDCCEATEARLLWHRPRHSGSAKSFRRDGDVDVRKVANVGEDNVRIPTMYSKLRPVGSLTTAVADAIGRLSLPGSELTKVSRIKVISRT